ncbi:Conserved hypothetical protein [Candidatus Protochlamydia naegleriophila]|uniref:protein-glutamate methylesterase n=1 Tax=Candidatus Protochlamydia naegleriophila TaxID=389348 RepID=A0A0U5ERK1_9BACT|nr:chemotaxis protein CheB [Candidatus Protochlamydia naegleriophila]CUI16769.1 Conserved hypothetical protein [Candidatus Protochlamydia naegleriophila]
MIPYPIEVLIVDDSPSSQELLSFIIKSDPELALQACVKNEKMGLDCLKRLAPAVIVINSALAARDRFKAIHYYMQTKPTSIIAICDNLLEKTLASNFQAICAGAIDVLEKPASFKDPHYAVHAQAIIQAIKMAAQVKWPSQHHETSFSTLAAAAQQEAIEEFVKLPKIEAIAIGASLGGPQALGAILSLIPKNFPIPFFVVQHISAGFTKGLVDWLQGMTSLQVQLTKDRTFAKPGSVYVAPEHFHMEIRKGGLIRLVDSLPEKGIRPSVGHLFRSIAHTYGSKGIGIILTGMGKDGGEDLLKMKQTGALTIAQDPLTSLLFGMPKEAIAIKAAKHVMSLQQIAALLKLIAKRPI